MQQKRQSGCRTVFVLFFSLLLASGSSLSGEDAKEPAANKAVSEGAKPANKLPPKIDAFTLVGTGSCPEGAMAFFDGNDPEFKTSLRPGGKIGGCTLVDVGFDYVRLREQEREIDLFMGKQLLRSDQGPWQVTALKEKYTPDDKPVLRSYPSSAPTAFASPSPGSRSREEPAPHMSEKDLKKLDKIMAEAMKHEKEFKPDKLDKEAAQFKKPEKPQKSEHNHKHN